VTRSSASDQPLSLDALLALVAAGVLARVLLAGLAEPWTDELYFAVTASHVPGELSIYASELGSTIRSLDASPVLERMPYLSTEAHPPLALLCQAPVHHAAPLVVLRLPSLFFSVATLAIAVAWVGWRWGRPAALAAALLLATAPPLLLHGTEVRPYSGAIFFGLVTSILACGPRDDRRWAGWRYALYGVLAALGMWTHYYVGALLPAHAVGALACWRRSAADRRHARGILLGLLLAGLLFALWAPVPLARARSFAAVGDAAPLEATDLLLLPFEALGACGIAGAAIALCAMVAGTVALARRAPRDALVLGLALPAALALALVAPHVHAPAGKHLAAAAAPALLLAAAAVTRARRWAQVVTWTLLGVLVLASARAVVVPREPWRQAWLAASLALQPGDVVAFSPPHAKLGFQRQASLAGVELLPADDTVRALQGWSLSPLGMPGLTDTEQSTHWILAADVPRETPQLLRVNLFGPHALELPAQPPEELLRGLEGSILLELGSVAR